MTKYLYGAAVQGIQGFIFQTNKLKEIVGASELVEQICTLKFAELAYGNIRNYYDAKGKLQADDNAILFAAGNIKYIFDKKEECERIVREFPKIVSAFAPGITVSQAVVEMSDGKAFRDAVNDLESRLRTQRNRPMRSLTMSLMGILRSRETGLPVTYRGKQNVLMDDATWAKLNYTDGDGNHEEKTTTLALCRKAFGEEKIRHNQVSYDISDMTGDNDWVAVIHADGNGLGQIVQKIGSDEKIFKLFSKNLDEATTQAAVNAYKAVKKKFEKSWKTNRQGESIIPIRPIVLGGDDLTVVCRADLALDYVTKFIEEFEEQTKKLLGDIIEKYEVFTVGEPRDRLTACAGIAYIKSSYPFYYGYELAEALCSQAKKDAKAGIVQNKQLPMSCLMFHKVQDSFTENWKDIAERELQPNANTSFEFGPYYIKERNDRWTVEKLNDMVDKLDKEEGGPVKTHLRRWMSLLHNNEGLAGQTLARLKQMSGDEMKKFVEEVTDEKTERNKKTVYPVYDILAMHTIKTQKTKND